MQTRIAVQSAIKALKTIVTTLWRTKLTTKICAITSLIARKKSIVSGTFRSDKMKKEVWFLGIIIIGLISGFAGAFMYQTVFVSQKNTAYEKLVSVPLTEISSYQLLQKISNGDKDFIIVDVRNKDAYDLGHIKGAVSMPLADIPLKYRELPKDKDIIVYCWSRECMLGPKASATLAMLGLTNIKELRIGWCEWSERGYQIDGKRYILSNECLQPQRSVNNEPVEIIENIQYGAS